MVKLNVGCGKALQEGFEGLDIIDFGQKYKCDARKKLPFKDDEVSAVYTRNFVPILTKPERSKFFNELYRILKPGGTVTLVVPAWNSAGGYGHPHFKEEIKEEYFYFLNKAWREANAPEVVELTCNFDPTWGYNMHPSIVTRNQEYQQFALSNYCNSALEIMITLKKAVPIESP